MLPSTRFNLGCLAAVVLALSACVGSPRSTPIPASVAPPRSATSTLRPITATRLPLPAQLGGNWRLVFHDEFNGPALDTHVWQTQYPWGRLNPPEAQYYAPDAFEIKNGILRIKAEKRSMDGQSYTSGLIATSEVFSFTYGYAEIRARVPAGQGLWPGFWLLNNEASISDEIDVFEILGHAPQTVHTTMHYGHNQHIGQAYTGVDFSQDFHKFAVEWKPNAVTWYIDDVQRFRVTQEVVQKPMFVIANLAVGGQWPGEPDDTTHFPAYFDIDYIRVYQSDTTATP